MNVHLKTALITFPVGARRAVRVPEQKFLVPLPFKIGLITYILIAPLGHAEELGRLFFTPEQRAMLERGQQPDIGNTGQPGQPDQPAIAESLTVSGIVQKHGGERTVWINGVPQVAGKSDEQAPESVPVAIPGQAQPVKIKVGQKVQLSPPTPQKTEKQPAPDPDDD